ncbi:MULTISPECIES: IS66-like element accessory protein TnpA [Paraburkholderia]|jgi:transposase-like protein|uniref:Transposase-like protein n=1 Tax=Paraburkholderia terricola TaxID=169427 RepID=A0ABU1LZW6_9BURK|nr:MULTISPECIES: transposase [Paraburkholderia]MDR6412302.1 transposase-like protein [Paraburkholderia terricola]MDR6484631.1 transposase-like protein [Paraburkholderia terricola]OUL93735.1 transposase [Paraburkholderia hospita]
MTDNDRVNDEVVPATERRKHSREFKEMVVRAAMQPHVSIAAVALHYRLNANLVRRWVVAARQRVSGQPASNEAQPAAAFVPLQLQAPAVATDRGEIRIEVRRGGVTMTLYWPLSAADDCAAWLQGWLR